VGACHASGVDQPWNSALVTGASSGIGEALARRLAGAGVPTVVVARRRDRLDALAAAFPGVEVLAADLTTDDGIASVVARLEDPERPIDLLVNNAGFGTSGAFHQLDPARSRDEILLNVVALTRLSQAALPGMVGRGRGWVLNVSSVASFQAAPNLAVYAATKAYVTSLSEATHEELRSTGVKVTALCPGLTRTEFQEVSGGEGLTEKLPDFAWMTADEVAETGLRDAAKGVVVSVPGLANKAMVSTSSLLPRMLTRRIAGLVTRK
jgi:uncharacterized protein